MSDVEVKRVYKFCGIPVWSVTVKQTENGEKPLTAADNGGDTTTQLGFQVREEDT